MSTWPDHPFGAGDLWMHREKMQQGARAHYLKLVLSLETFSVSITIKSDTIKPDGVSHVDLQQRWPDVCPGMFCIAAPQHLQSTTELCYCAWDNPWHIAAGRRSKGGDACLRGRKGQLRDIKHRGTTSGWESPNQSRLTLFYSLSYANWFHSIIHSR